MTKLLVFVARSCGRVLYVDCARPEAAIPWRIEQLWRAEAEVTVYQWGRKDPPPTNASLSAVNRAPTWHLERTYQL